MRILADENIEDQTVTALRDAGHDVLWVREERPRTPDPDPERAGMGDAGKPVAGHL